MPHVVNCALRKSMKGPLNGTFFARSNRGLVRLHNEDVASVVINASGDVLLVVADGMGGYEKGDYASKVAVDTLVESFKQRSRFFTTGGVVRFMRHAVKQANRIIFEESQTDLKLQNMGTTLVAAVIRKNKIIFLNIGDSRAYFYYDNKLEQVTQDQSYVQFLVRTKQITGEQAKTHPKRHVLLNALGNIPSCNMDITKLKYHGESVLLCSDGLYNTLEPRDIEAIFATEDTSEQKGQMLISLANNRGGEDNIAVALWEPSYD